jgi:hypothetical protein
MSKDLKEHLSVFHRSKMSGVEAGQKLFFSQRVLNDEFDPFSNRIIFAFSDMFLHSAICTPTLFCCIVQYVCPKANAMHYGYRVVLYNEECEEEALEHVVLSNNHDLHDVLEKRKCIYSPNNKLERFYHFNPRGLLMNSDIHWKYMKSGQSNYRIQGLVIGFIGPLQIVTTSKAYASTVLHTSQITVGHTSPSQSVTVVTSRCLVAVSNSGRFPSIGLTECPGDHPAACNSNSSQRLNRISFHTHSLINF